jgi:hypothetical protein
MNNALRRTLGILAGAAAGYGFAVVSQCSGAFG